jgi:hypothetical protein
MTTSTDARPDRGQAVLPILNPPIKGEAVFDEQQSPVGSQDAADFRKRA